MSTRGIPVTAPPRPRPWWEAPEGFRMHAVAEHRRPWMRRKAPAGAVVDRAAALAGRGAPAPPQVPLSIRVSNALSISRTPAQSFL